MGNSNSTQPVSDTISQIAHPLLAQRIQNIDSFATQSEIQDLDQDAPSPRLRYVQVLLEQGRLGKGLPEMVDRCVNNISKNKPSTEYIKVIFDLILTAIQEGQMIEGEGVGRLRRIVWEVRVKALRSPGTSTKAEEIELEAIIADTYQRLSPGARRRWQSGDWTMR